jgi:hypothetical protein
VIPFEKSCGRGLEVERRPDRDEWQQRMNRESDRAGKEADRDTNCEQPVFEVA